MLSFKQHTLLCEEARKVLKSNRTIYRNPTDAEWRDIPAWVRGIVSKDGDLFVTSEGRASSGLHRRIRDDTETAYEEFRISKDIGDFITVHRRKKSKAFLFGESEPLGDTGDGGPDWRDNPRFALAKRLFRQARKNNPKVLFVLQNIHDFTERDSDFMYDD